MAPTAPGGIKKKKGNVEMTVPEFAMPPDAVPGIAQVIVDAWNGVAGLDKILERNNAGPPKEWPRKLLSTKPQRQSMQRHQISI